MTLIPPIDLLTARGDPDSVAPRVFLREILDGAEFRRPGPAIPLAVGMDGEGNHVVVDLAAVGHVLIAGGPGSGKSTVLHALVLSLLYSHSPETIQLLLVDTKLLELGAYAKVPHLVHPLIGDARQVLGVVTWLEREVERRLNLLLIARARSIQEYNERVRGTAPGGRTGSGILPYFVVAIDDLLEPVFFFEDVSVLLGRLAVLMDRGRPCGIHVIGVTYHPSAVELQQLVPHAFPCRIGLWLPEPRDRDAVAQDSQYTWDSGRGEMALASPGLRHPIRVQGTFVSNEDVDRVVQWYDAQARPTPDAQVAAGIDAALHLVERQEPISEYEDVGLDPLFRQAAEVCIQNQLGSTSLLQRRMSIGYGRAARLIDQLETAGVLGPARGSRPRDVLVTLEGLIHISGPEVFDHTRGKEPVRTNPARGKGYGCLPLIGIIAATCVTARVL